MEKFLSASSLQRIFADDEKNPSKIAILEDNNLVEFLCILKPEIPEIGSIHIVRIHQVFRQHKLERARTIESIASTLTVFVGVQKLYSLPTHTIAAFLEILPLYVHTIRQKGLSSGPGGPITETSQLRSLEMLRWGSLLAFMQDNKTL